jgi:Fe-S oxidoreductase
VGAARRRARGALDRLAPHALAGRPIAVLEPSCWSMLVDDLPRLVPDDPRAGWVAAAAVTFERALLDLGLPALLPADEPIVLHDHCHARALGAGEHARAALELVPDAVVRPSGAGCCGMAGSFGYQHPELSRRIAEDRLAPAMRAAPVAVATGTSCRQQILDVAGRRAQHPAEYLAARLP